MRTARVHRLWRARSRAGPTSCRRSASQIDKRRAQLHRAPSAARRRRGVIMDGRLVNRTAATYRRSWSTSSAPTPRGRMGRPGARHAQSGEAGVRAKAARSTDRASSTGIWRRSKRNVAHHYDLGDGLYDLFLDRGHGNIAAPTSPIQANPLEQAQADKKAHIAAKLALKPGQRVLDIGCGWGGMALYLNRDRRTWTCSASRSARSS